MSPELFVGLVTHPRSRFPEAVTEKGLAGQVVRAAQAAGVTVEAGLVNEDLLRPGQISLDSRAVKASIKAEVNLERRWREHVGGKATLRVRAVLTAMKTKRILKLAPPWRRHLAENDPGPRMLRRLANIELAHLAILRQARDSQARWSLILEDDAQVEDVAEFTEQLLQFINAANKAGMPRTMNLSESFTIDQLGIGALLTPTRNDGQPESWNTLEAARLVTNTVCAVLYEKSFLEQLVAALDAIPIEPVVPIDFKVNVAFLGWEHVGKARAGDCWVCSPAPLMQGSGVPQARM